MPTQSQRVQSVASQILQRKNDETTTRFFASIVRFGADASAQTASAQTCTILVTKLPFKIKLERTVSSATARVSDYIQFTTLENIYSNGGDKCPAVLFEKGTSIFGAVSRRKHRHFPFKKGELEVTLEPLKNWDGTTIPIVIMRRIEGYGRKPLPTNDPPKLCKYNPLNCLAGRKDNVVGPLVPAVATAGSTAVAGIADDKTTRIIAISGLFTLISQGGLAELLNGTDAVLQAGEVFDLIIEDGVKVVPPRKDP